MNSALGQAGLVLSAVSSFLALLLFVSAHKSGNISRRRSANYFVLTAFVGALLSVVALEHGLVTNDFTMNYVSSNSSRETPLLYQVTAMWSSLSGSILLWALMLSGYSAVVALKARGRLQDSTVAMTLAVLSFVSLFFFLMMLFSANPFLSNAKVPFDGNGPNPLLQDYPLVAFHPPMLYLGYVGLTVPFAYAIASLITKREDSKFAAETRNFATFAWAALTIGIFLGAWWSYQVLGWGGYWAWDPVENAAFLPWLTATAYIHSSLSSERGGNLRLWNVSLLVATFSLTILGTFFTRSGVLQSVHSFSASSLGPILIGFFALVLIGSLVLIVIRAPQLHLASSKSTRLTRDGAFFANNILFVAFALIVLIGTSFPLLAQAVSGSVVTVGPPFYNSFTAPLGLVIVFLMTAAPLLNYRANSLTSLFERLFPAIAAGLIAVLVAVFVGNRDLGFLGALAFGVFAIVGAGIGLFDRIAKRVRHGNLDGAVVRSVGSYLAHFGVAVVAIALATSTAFGTRGQLTISPMGHSYFHGHKIGYSGVYTVVTPARTELLAKITIDGRGYFTPGISQFGTNSSIVGTPAVSTGILRDVYVTLDSPPTSATSSVVIGVVVEPLVSWLWIGGLLLGGGGVVATIGALASNRARRRRRSPGEVISGDVPKLVER